MTDQVVTFPGFKGVGRIALLVKDGEVVGYAATDLGTMVRHSMEGDGYVITRWCNAPKWKRFTGKYSKQWYDVKTQDGKIYQHCWPNAGYMCLMDDSGTQWSEEDEIYFRRSIIHPMGGLQ